MALESLVSLPIYQLDRIALARRAESIGHSHNSAIEGEASS
jgi:hypothetical protein